MLRQLLKEIKITLPSYNRGNIMALRKAKETTPVGEKATSTATIKAVKAKSTGKGEKTEEVVKDSEATKPVTLDGGKVAIVKYSVGVTKNLGNFESLRVDVGVEIPTSINNLPGTFKKVRKWADDQLQKCVDEASQDESGGDLD